MLIRETGNTGDKIITLSRITGEKISLDRLSLW